MKADRCIKRCGRFVVDDGGCGSGIDRNCTVERRLVRPRETGVGGCVQTAHGALSERAINEARSGGGQRCHDRVRLCPAKGDFGRTQALKRKRSTIRS